MPAKIYLIRHGETDYNRERRMQGWLDIPLNEVGHTQAREAARKLQGHQLHALYSSDLRRAQETAQHLSSVVGLSINLTPALRERDMGIFAGWAWEKERDEEKDRIWAEFEAARDLADPTWNKHQGESIGQMTTRIVNFFQEVRKLHAGRSVAMVTHGGTVNRFLEHLELKHPQEGFRSIRNASVLVLHKQDTRYILEEL